MVQDGLAWSFFRFLGLLLLGCTSAVAQKIIPVTGVVDRGTYDDRVSLRVPAQVGFVYFVTLNGVPILADVPVQLTDPDFYELWVTRTPTGDGGTATGNDARKDFSRRPCAGDGMGGRRGRACAPVPPRESPDESVSDRIAGAWNPLAAVRRHHRDPWTHLRSSCAE